MTTPPGSWQPAEPASPYPGPPPSGPPPYGQAPYGQAPYGQAPYGYGYGDPPPGYGTPLGPDAAWAAWGPPAVPPGVVLVPGVPPMDAATPGQRALGRLIDSVGYLVLLAAAAVAMFVIIEHAEGVRSSYSGVYASRSDGLEVLWIYPVFGAVWVIIVAYESLMIGLTGATVGDRLMGVRFVNTRDGGRPGFGRALGRAALLGASAVVCSGLVFLLLLFSMFFDSGSGRYQSWTDKLCGLQAVSTKG